MPNTREKLLDLLYRADKECCNKDCMLCNHSGKKFFCKIHFYVEHLIANRVKIPTLCKECKWWKKEFDGTIGRCSILMKVTMFDDFCSRGKKEGAE